MTSNWHNSLRRGLWLGGAVVLLVAAWNLALPADRTHMEFDYYIYETVTDLGNVADVVVAGEVSDVAARFDDRGGDPETDQYGNPIPGIPMVVYEFDVDTIVKGDIEAKTLLVGVVDLDRVTTPGLTPLKEGQSLVLFLDHVTVDEAPDIGSVSKELWVPISDDNGIFDVSDGHASPRLDDVVVRLTDGSPDQDDFALSELAAVLQAVP